MINLQWLQRRTRDRKVPGSSPCTEKRRENFLLQGQLSSLLTDSTNQAADYDSDTDFVFGKHSLNLNRRSATQRDLLILC